MKFVLHGRAFLLPSLSGLILFFQNWIPHATEWFALFNATNLLVCVIDYFLIPEASAFSVQRQAPKVFYQGRSESVQLVLACRPVFSLRFVLCDRLPSHCEADQKLFSGILNKKKDHFAFSYRLTPGQRGKMEFGEIGFRVSTRLGLVGRKFVLCLPQSREVYPEFLSDPEGLQTRIPMLDKENRTLRHSGPGREFSQLRDYVRGDEPRLIDWKRSARMEKLLAKEFEPEKGQNVILVFDGGRLMMAEYEGKSKLDWALASGFTIAREAIKKKDAVGVVGFNNQLVRFLSPFDKKSQFPAFVKCVYDFHPSFLEPDYRDIFQWIYRRIHQRSILIIYTDVLDHHLSRELSQNLHLLQRRHRVICCAVSFPHLKTFSLRQSSSLQEASESAVARWSLDSRSRVLADLRRQKVRIVDAPPEKLTGMALSAYLQARWG